MKHSGGCLCGEVRFEVEGKPSFVGVCHCKDCQLRTGSLFGVGVFLAEEKILVLSGNLEDYSYETASGNTIRLERCTNCGTSIFWKSSSISGITGTAGGTYDPPTFWYDITREIYTRSKADFCIIDAPETYVDTPG